MAIEIENRVREQSGIVARADAAPAAVSAVSPEASDAPAEDEAAK
jgi:hypothetical protein